MKSIRKIIYVLVLVIFTQVAFAQNDSRPIAVQVGTGHLVNGICSIKLNEETTADGYFVSITASGPTQGLYAVKSNGSFVVKGKAAEKVDFDYVIFIKAAPMTQTTQLIKNRVAPSK